MTSKISLASRLVSVKEQVSCDLAGEVVILNLRKGEYFGLNPVAARIWELLQSPTSASVVRDRLLEEFPDVERDRCTEDLLDILSEFAEVDLVEVISAEAEMDAVAN